MVTDARAYRAALAATLRAELAAAQIVPTQLAPLVGMNHQTLRRAVNADRDVSVYELLAIAKALQMPYEALIEQTEKRLEAATREQRQVQQRTDRELG